MGGTKAFMDQIDAQSRDVRRVLFAAKLLKRCPWHDVIFDTGDDVDEQTYKIANALISRDEIQLDGMSRREFAALLKPELDRWRSIGGCPRCEDEAEE